MRLHYLNARLNLATEPSLAITAELVAVLAAVTDGEPRILTTAHGQTLPSGPFQSAHRSMQAGMRAWIESETHHPIGYIEQLYTFADKDRSQQDSRRFISITYLGLTREASAPLRDSVPHAGWRNWYHYFPWEDRRNPASVELVEQRIVPALQRWIADTTDASVRQRRQQRVAYNYGLHDSRWNEDLVLQRYELLYEATLVPEARRARASAAVAQAAGVHGASLPGLDMLHDHRRILATGIARLRAKLKYRPVMFELMPPAFTLLQLQQTVEALSGCWLHKQNFRRLIEQQQLVEETGDMAVGKAGRPAKLFRFRAGVLQERAIAGSKLPMAR